MQLLQKLEKFKGTEIVVSLPKNCQDQAFWA